mmetsp:Transcript_68282/g.158479  ORF Transcript_68282/g.158479 Transcript_68282/m.158479 type:complete len:280 (+) Transcript_68282:107-946(+)
MAGCQSPTSKKEPASGSLRNREMHPHLFAQAERLLSHSSTNAAPNFSPSRVHLTTLVNLALALVLDLFRCEQQVRVNLFCPLLNRLPLQRLRHEDGPPKELHCGPTLDNCLEKLLVEGHGVHLDPLARDCKLCIGIPADARRHGTQLLLEEVNPQVLEVLDLEARDGLLQNGLGRFALGLWTFPVRVDVKVALFRLEALPDAWQSYGHVEVGMVCAAVALHKKDHIRQSVVLLYDPPEVGSSLVSGVGNVLENNGIRPPAIGRLQQGLRAFSPIKVVSH